jgi:hypothetical protein
VLVDGEIDLRQRRASDFAHMRRPGGSKRPAQCQQAPAESRLCRVRCGDYIYNHQGAHSGLKENALHVIPGDIKADPNDGDSVDLAINQLQTTAANNREVGPRGMSAVESAQAQSGASVRRSRGQRRIRQTSPIPYWATSAPIAYCPPGRADTTEGRGLLAEAGWQVVPAGRKSRPGAAAYRLFILRPPALILGVITRRAWPGVSVAGLTGPVALAAPIRC